MATTRWVKFIEGDKLSLDLIFIDIISVASLKITKRLYSSSYRIVNVNSESLRHEFISVQVQQKEKLKTYILINLKSCSVKIDCYFD